MTGSEVTITLPDGTQRSYPRPVTGQTVAESIGPGLAKAALAVKVDGELRDLAREIDGDAALEIVTRKSGDEALELLRHDCAHVLAEAVQELYPGTQVTFGPATENGFYYDFARSEPFTPEDLEKIEERMHEIVKRDETIEREVWDREEAIEYFKSIGETYKAEHIATLPREEVITIYRQGDWLDLCRGPHLPSTGKLGHAFKLQRISGVQEQGRPQGPSPHAGGGGQARPPQAGARDGPFSPAGGSRRLGVLAPEGLDLLPHGGKLYAPPPGKRRLSGGENPPAHRPAAVGSLRPLGEVPRGHVHR